jgi:hypothetical protein
MNDVGRVLARVHTASTPGVWRPDENGTWPDPVEMRERFITDRAAEGETMLAAGLTAEEVARVVGMIGTSPHVPAPAARCSAMATSPPSTCSSTTPCKSPRSSTGGCGMAARRSRIWPMRDTPRSERLRGDRRWPRDRLARRPRLQEGAGRRRRQLRDRASRLAVPRRRRVGLASTISVMRRTLDDIVDTGS